MIRSLMILGALAGAAQPAAARDNRLHSRVYNADEVVRIDGRAGVQATISFAEDEHIENVAIGDSNSWQVTPNKRANLLFVKPLAARARTNLTVVTDRRSYYFDLVAAPTANALYLLRFTYPDEPKKVEAKTADASLLNAAERDALTAPQTATTRGPSNAQLNFGWKQRGSAKVMPARVYDDGNSTFISWAPGRPVPAVLIRNEKGAEGPVNYSVREDVMVVEGVPSVIVLRSGRDQATLEYGRSVGPATPQRVSATVAATAVSQMTGRQ